MREDLDDLLCLRYPKIFAERHLFMHQSSMCYGFQCGDGWFDLIDTLCQNLQFQTDHKKAPQVVVKQVKTKYGLLCIEEDAANELQKGMIQMTEFLSDRICDICGHPAIIIKHSIRRRVWVRCASHVPEMAGEDGEPGLETSVL